jgi:hypothetical protein
MGRRSEHNALQASAETKEEWTELYEGVISEKRAEINGRKDRFWTGTCGVPVPFFSVRAGNLPLRRRPEPGPRAGFLCNKRAASEPTAPVRHSAPARLYILQASRPRWTVAASSVVSILLRHHPFVKEPRRSFRPADNWPNSVRLDSRHPPQRSTG